MGKNETAFLTTDIQNDFVKISFIYAGILSIIPGIFLSAGYEVDVIKVDKFGAGAPYKDIFKYYDFTVENIIN